MYISGSDGKFIWGEEGSTQGDVTAMPFYGISTRPIIDDLLAHCDAVEVWYADDSSAAGSFAQLMKFWLKLLEIGPKYGYHPNPKKTVLIVKNEHELQEAKDLFHSTGIKITTEGERHLGAVVGSHKFRKEYIKEKVDAWVLGKGH